jgi:MFS family permease
MDVNDLLTRIVKYVVEGIAVALALVFIPRKQLPMDEILTVTIMAAAVFVAGATLASISPVSLALQGVVTEPWNYSRSNAIYNAFYAAGMLLGPPLSSVLFERFGGAGMLAHLAALWVAFAAFGLVYASDDPAAARSTG